MRDRMESALRKSRADYTEIRIERTTSSWMNFRGPELDSIGSSSTVGGIVRAMVRGGWGLATFNDLADLEGRAEQAYDCARLVGEEKSRLAEIEPITDSIRADLKKDFRGMLLDDKRKVIEGYNEIILKHHERIETTNVNYSDRFSQIWYANSDGTYIEDERPDLSLFLSATARDGDRVQTTFEIVAGNQGFETIEGLEQKAETVAKRVIALLSAPPVKGGQYTVILDPRLAGVFAHEAFGHLSESDHLYENPKMRDLMVLGKCFGPEILNIVDDGSIPGLYGTRKYDDEGVRTGKNYMIKDGILVGRLHSRETAAKMGEELTGNARAISYQYPPIVRMTNTYIDVGDNSFEDMIKDVKLGVYALGMLGGQTMAEMFTFSAAYGHMIRDGQVAEMVRDVVLTGNVFRTLMDIDMIGNQMEWTDGSCGKGVQNPLPVTTGSPHIRIQNVVVGGTQ